MSEDSDYIILINGDGNYYVNIERSALIDYGFEEHEIQGEQKVVSDYDYYCITTLYRDRIKRKKYWG